MKLIVRAKQQHAPSFTTIQLADDNGTIVGEWICRNEIAVEYQIGDELILERIRPASEAIQQQ